MPGDSASGSLLSGMISITAPELGKKIGLGFVKNLITSPESFFIHMGLSKLFDSTNDKLDQISSRLDALESEVEGVVGKLTAVIEEAELNEQFSRINQQYQNLSYASDTSTDPASQYASAYEAFYSQDPVGIMNSIGTDLECIYNEMTGHYDSNGQIEVTSTGIISNGYLKVYSDKLYASATSLNDFSNQMRAIDFMCHATLLKAIQVLACIRDNVTDQNLLAKKADALLEQIHQYDQGISIVSQSIQRDSFLSLGLLQATNQSLIRNKATGQCLGRYLELASASNRHHVKLELKPKDDGYFYINVVDSSVGIDHWYGERIEPVRKSDSDHPNHLWRFVPVGPYPYRWYKIQNKATGRALDHYYGNSIKDAPADEHPNHLWEVVPSRDGGHYCTIANKATGALLGYDSKHSCINAFGGKEVLDAGIHNPEFAIVCAAMNANWRFVQYGSDKSGSYNLVNIINNQALDHYDGESFRFVGYPTGNPNHLWQLNPTKQDAVDKGIIASETLTDDQKLDQIGTVKAYHFIRNNGSHQVLDHFWGNSLAGATDGNCTAPHPNHIWKLEKVNAS